MQVAAMKIDLETANIVPVTSLVELHTPRENTTTRPIIAFILFMATICLNAVQFLRSPFFLQRNTPLFLNVFLYIYNLVGINGFLINGPVAQLFTFLLSFCCLAIIEITVGHTRFLYYLLVCFMYSISIVQFSALICDNNKDEPNLIESKNYS